MKVKFDKVLIQEISSDYWNLIYTLNDVIQYKVSVDKMKACSLVLKYKNVEIIK